MELRSPEVSLWEASARARAGHARGPQGYASGEKAVSLGPFLSCTQRLRFWVTLRKMRLLVALACVLPLSAQTIFFHNVRVFDGERILPRSSVLVENGLIRAVGPDLRQPAKTKVIEGGGKTLLPGLIDAHTHIFFRSNYGRRSPSG